MKIHCLQHVPFEGPGSIAAWAKRNNHPIGITKLYKNDPFPDLNAIDWLVVMGGPMGVHDEAVQPWLIEEKAFIKKAVEQGNVIIGVCLGAQLIAHALGAGVYPNRYREIGWFPVHFDLNPSAAAPQGIFPATAEVFHWHGDTFDLPAGATRLASSVACRNQAFVWQNRVYGFQFHLEITARGATDLLEHCGDEIEHAPYIQTPTEILMDDGRFAHINRLMDLFLDRLSSKGGRLTDTPRA